MELKQAVQILKDHNEWRRDKSEFAYPVDTPKDIGIAIDVIIDHLNLKL